MQEIGCITPKKLWVSSALILLVISGVFLVLGSGRHLNLSFSLDIYQAEGEVLLYSEKVVPGQEIILSYRHSSDGTPVEQVLRIGNDGFLHMVEERYSWYGAGLEFGSGYELCFEEDTVFVRGYDRKFDLLPIRVARTVPQFLKISGKKISFSELAPAGTRLFLKIEM